LDREAHHTGCRCTGLPVGDHHIACFVSKGLDGQTHVGANARSVDHRAVFWFSASAGFEQRLSNFNNVQYVGDIEVGGQQVGALFDTGSDDLVLRSAECHGCTHHAPPYDHHRSEHYKLHGVIHKITYGAGSCSVVRGWDSVSVGPLHAPEQEIWEVMHHSIPLWEHAAYSALVGMSPTAGSGYVRGSTLLASLGVDAFSVCLGRANGSDGYLTWGALRAPGHPAARLLVHDQWVARLGNITLAGAPSVRLCGSSPCSVLLDTGHSLIEGPQAQILELSKHIDGGARRAGVSASVGRRLVEPPVEGGTSAQLPAVGVFLNGPGRDYHTALPGLIPSLGAFAERLPLSAWLLWGWTF